MSTVSKGNDFRDTIARALIAASFRNVETEKRLGEYKKVDVYYESVEFGNVIRFAIEAKNYERSLTKSYISANIQPDYKPLLDNGVVDKVIIIAPHDVGPDARAYMSANKFMFMTLEQFHARIMNFLTYLDGLQTGYKEGGLDKYYMPLFYGDNLSLENRLLSWLDEEDSKPIAILAGYGMGKTTFSKHFACKLAASFKEKNSGRIPIYIRLGEISDEQSLEGLLAKSLISSNAVQNFTFELFMELNRAGLFCVLLDGFDEMKHAMTWDQFKHNVNELNRLVDKKSKVVLLGRPSAFISESEQALVLRGVRAIDAAEVRDYAWNIYDRVELNLFTPSAAIEFIKKYISHVVESCRIECDEDVEFFVSKRIDEIKALGFSDIILRPVQAKMLAEIASEPKQLLESYSRYGLYKHFMDCIIEREIFKKSRKVFSSDVRRSFIRELAWWMWCSGGNSGLSLSEIPSWLIDKYRDGKQVEREAALRDLISGSVLETKMADKFYFPHRSYQEFLVSEYIINLSPDIKAIDKIKSAINREIVDFIKESDKKSALKIVHDLLPEYQGSLSLQFIELLAWASDEIPDPKSITCEWHMITAFYKCLTERGASQAGEYALSVAVDPDARNLTITTLLCLSWAVLASKNEDTKFSVALASLILRLSLPQIEKIVSAKKMSKIALQTGTGGAWLDMVLKGFKTERFNDSMVVVISVEEIFESARSSLLPKIKVVGFEDFELQELTLNIPVLGRYDDLLSVNKKGGVLARYFRDHHMSQTLVPVTKKATVKNNFPDWLKS
ncbi:NACHT domain-containing protein [Pseudomonas knackmussii]|uniref:NACHT domain-containing protein n=1 Tax=Pseudomonas knackmussii TaxID=65741 RepID=A0ABY4KQ85_9PSED|nr:NACHT domain-containing protein [Pseudomonas knackmussii]UPQ83031.1 NACHT domain-containing protein [Pseudomonas knackmussii]